MGSKSLNEIDIGILRCLYENCRMSYEEIARRIGVSSTTIKKHVEQLNNDGILGQFSIRLRCSVIDARIILVWINTNGSEKRENFVNELGKSHFIEVVSCLNDGRYFVNAICIGLEQLFQIQSFFNQQSCIISYEIYLIDKSKSTRDSFTKLELDIIDILYTDPTMSISDIAKRINRSAKGVRLALKRLLDTNSIRFTIQPHIHFYCIKISLKNNATGQELHQRIWKELPRVWEIFFSSTKVVIFVTFFIEHISDITHIRRWFTNRSFCRIEVEAIGEPMRYYDSIRTEALHNMISKTQVS